MICQKHSRRMGLWVAIAVAIISAASASHSARPLLPVLHALVQ
jgi:hypothetical protein